MVGSSELLKQPSQTKDISTSAPTAELAAPGASAAPHAPTSSPTAADCASPSVSSSAQLTSAASGSGDGDGGQPSEAGVHPLAAGTSLSRAKSASINGVTVPGPVAAGAHPLSKIATAFSARPERRVQVGEAVPAPTESQSFPRTKQPGDGVDAPGFSPPSRSSTSLRPSSSNDFLNVDPPPLLPKFRFVQNEERTWGGWKPSTQAGVPPYMDEHEGHEVSAEDVAELLEKQEIQVFVDEKTDRDGWYYGAVFWKLDEPRIGGRRIALPLDLVRRRRYVAVPVGSTTALSDSFGATPSSSTWFKGVGPSLDASDREAMSKLFELLFTYLKKRHPSDILSVMTDPTVPFRVMWQHDEVYKHSLEAACDPIDLKHLSDADRQMLSNASRAAEFACAVYGAAMAEGHLDSVAAFLGGAAAHHAGAWNDVENLIKFRKFSKVRQEDMVAASWVEKTFEPAWVIVLDHARKWVVLTIRGTVDWRAVLTDATAHCVEICGGHTHEGMLRAAQGVIARALPHLRATLREHSDYQLVCTGHSLGAAAATLVALLLRKNQVDLKEDDPKGLREPLAFGIGTPPLLSMDLAEECLGWVVSVERGVDFISRLSVFAMDRLLLEMTQASAAKLATDWFLKSMGYEDNTQQRWQRTFGTGQEVAIVLFPPGRLLHMDTTWNGSEPTQGTKPRKAYWATSSFYQRYLLGTTMLNDHLPREYFLDISLLSAAAEAASGPQADSATVADSDMAAEDFVASSPSACGTKSDASLKGEAAAAVMSTSMSSRAAEGQEQASGGTGSPSSLFLSMAKAKARAMSSLSSLGGSRQEVEEKARRASAAGLSEKQSCSLPGKEAAAASPSSFSSSPSSVPREGKLDLAQPLAHPFLDVESSPI